MDPGALVQSCYDAIAGAYLSGRAQAGPDVELLRELERRLSFGARVLDLGCGAGVPITLRLSRRFCTVGLDFSAAQIDLARQNVPSADFHVADMTEADLGVAAYDAVVSYYAIIHIPRQKHEPLLHRIATALRPEGLALLCLGAQDLESDLDEYFGKTMFWSHFAAPVYLEMAARAGLIVRDHWLIQDGDCPQARHLFALMQKPALGGPVHSVHLDRFDHHIL